MTSCRGPRTTGQFAALSALRTVKLPKDTPMRVKVAVRLVRFLAFHNRLDGIMCFVAVWWAGWTLAYPPEWGPIRSALSSFTAGEPIVVSWALLISGIFGYISIIYQRDRLRTFTSLVGFSMWGLLFVAHLTAENMYAPAVACYSVFAIAKLLAYVGHQVGLDMEVQADLARIEAEARE